MDQLCILSASAGLILSCGKASLLLHNFISDAKTVDTTIQSLINDVTSLKQLLTNVKIVFARPEIDFAVTHNVEQLQRQDLDESE